MHGEAVSKEHLRALRYRCTERQVQEEAGESLAGTMLRQIKTESIILDIQSRLQLADGRKVCLGSCSTVARASAAGCAVFPPELQCILKQQQTLPSSLCR